MRQAPVALVTGSSRGIGRAILLDLAVNGWDVIVNYVNNQQAGEQVAQQARENGVKAISIQADIASSHDRQQLLDTIKEHFGRIDLLVNNAGMAPRQRVDVLQVTEKSYDEVMAANLKGTFFLTQIFARWMLELIQTAIITQAKIINIGSISAYTASTERAEYCLSKAGLGMMTALFAVRLADEGILVYEIRPGIIATDMTRVAKSRYDQVISEGLTPIRRWGQPDDIARAVRAIALDEFPFSTGEIINVDGGFHIRKL
jgi:NAD(P)-dependent dehydrogenase (short-subunit alcohol dehydrogenase family)